MKTTLILLTSAILLGCSSIKKLDTTGFTSKNNTIFYEKDTIATLSAIEYSSDNKKYVNEMTFKLLNLNHADKVKNLLFFIHQRHKDWEIELDYPTTNFRINNE